MSSWRVLTLSQQYDTNVPQLLIKTCFEGKSYSVFLTDLSNIWSEELDLAGIVDRASSEQSPIEVSTQDCTQLAILLDNVQKSLRDSGDATCLISHAHLDGINIQTSITLPEPLGQLRWKFCLEKRTSTILKNELILPLLVSSHIQHERINDLISKVTEKDKAITRLLDQYESSNLDLAAAFPSISGLKAGRKYVRRDQVARHVPALQNFHEELWRGETEKLESSEFTTLELFQEALSQCPSSVPLRLKVDDEEAWWTIIPDRINAVSPKPKPKAASAPKVPEPIESSEDETEDEFETHENFKLRNTPKKPSTVPKPTSHAPFRQPEASDDGTTDDDEDLDAPLKTGSQTRSEIVRSQADRQISPAPEASPPLKPNLLPTQKPKGFRIGGKAKNVVEPMPTQEDSDWGKVGNESKEASMPTRSKDGVEQKPENHDTQKTVKKGFKIGGKGKGAVDNSGSRPDPEPSLQIDHVEQSKGAMAASIAPPSIKHEKKRIPTEETREETAEEKAERKRSELKRKNEELVKKQAQTKKKKRF